MFDHVHLDCIVHTVRVALRQAFELVVGDHTPFIHLSILDVEDIGVTRGARDRLFDVHFHVLEIVGILQQWNPAARRNDFHRAEPPLQAGFVLSEVHAERFPLLERRRENGYRFYVRLHFHI